MLRTPVMKEPCLLRYAANFIIFTVTDVVSVHYAKKPDRLLLFS